MNATRLIFSLALFMGLALAGCGGGSSPLPNDGGVVTPAPDMPDGNGNTGSNDAPSGGDDSDNNDASDGSNDLPAPDDPYKPEIVSTDPKASDNTVDANTVITVEFDEIIDPVSATLSSVSLEGPGGKVGIDVSVSGTQMIIKPETRLDGGTAYTATVSGGIRDLLGNPMGSDYSWQFVVRKELTGLCADFYGEGFSLIEGKIASPAGWLAKPPRGVPFADPAHGTCMVRASNAQGELGVTWARNNYSRLQPFNADSSRYLVISEGGRWFIHRTADTAMIRELKIRGGTSLEPHWHPTKPDVLYMLDGDGGLTIREYNVMTDDIKVVADLRSVESIAGYPGLTSITQIWPTATRAWTRWEGSPSADGRYWGFMVQSGFDPSTGLGLITYDMKTDTITGVYDYDLDGGGVIQPDHVSMSPSGKYIVPSWADAAVCDSMSQLGTRNNPCGLMAFSRDFSSAVGLTAASPHSDIGVDANGRDVMVAGDYDTGWVTMWDLETGKRTQLWNFWENGGGTSMHLSARNFDKPGWFLVSTYNARNSNHWYANKIFAIEMAANPRILNIANTHNNYVSYWTEPHAAVNRDFTRIMFNSNWGSGGDNTDVYMISLPYDAVPEK